MLELHPFDGAVVVADRAQDVVAPPYDALSPAVRATLAATDPDSYLGALPPGSGSGRSGLDASLQRCRAHLAGLLAGGRYRRLPAPAVGVLALGAGTGRAIAVLGDVPVGAFAALHDGGADPDAASNGGAPDGGPRTDPRRGRRAGPGADPHGGPRPGFRPGDGLVRPHERVHEARVAELARYLEVVGVASSPVALTQPPDARLTELTTAIAATPPDVAYRAADGVDVALWCVTDPPARDALCAAVAAAGPASLVDGHHRGAAAVRHAAARGPDPTDPAGRVLCAVLPSDHLTVRAFHRRMDAVLAPDASDAALAPVLARLASAGVVVHPLDGPRRPGRPGHVSMTATGRWWDLDLSTLAREGDPVEGLDVRTVERDLVPLLRGSGPPAPPAPVADPLGLDTLVAPGAIGLALHPPGIDTVLAIAAAGGVLPPKTTYVTPKLRSGLVVTSRSPASPL